MRNWAIAASLLLVGGGLALHWRSEPARAGLRVATYNIELFGGEKLTDIDRLRSILEGLDADVIAVQEIMEPARFERLVDRLEVGGRRYRWVSSACGGRSKMHVGFVYDAARVGFEGTREYPQLSPDGEGACHESERPGLLGQFRAEGKAFELLAVHMAAGGEREKMQRRRVQWQRAFEIVAQRRKAGVRAVGILGDTNSTGFLDNRGDERRFIEGRVKAEGMRLTTAGLECSEYFHPSDADGWIPSLLDHVIVTPEFPVAAKARVHGYCLQAGCRRLPEPPNDYVRVSDHCPVTVE